MLHVLTIPSEMYIPSYQPLLGIFQHHLIQTLAETDIKLGVLSFDMLPIYRYHKQIFSEKMGLSIEKDGNAPVVRYRLAKFIPKMLALDAMLIRSHIEEVYEQYCVRWGKPDLIHAHNAIFAGHIGEILYSQFQTPYVLTEHSSFFYRNKLPQMYKKIARSAFQNAALVTAVSHSLADKIQIALEEQFSNIMVVPNVLDREFEFHAQTNMSHSKRVNGEPFHFLTIGNLIDIKNHALLLKAFAKAFGGKNEYLLRIGGNGHLRRELETLSSTLGIEDQVTFLGYLNRDQVLNELSSCDVFVLSSLRETFGVVLIEALSCGKPVLSTACGGPNDIVTPANGKLVPVDDIEAMSFALKEMASNIKSYDNEKIRNGCIARYGAKRLANQWRSIYERTLSSGL
jgi:glycosyltransferase involved in cell wall biosynthesis